MGFGTEIKVKSFVTLQEKTTVLSNLPLQNWFSSNSQRRQEAVSLVKCFPQFSNWIRVPTYRKLHLHICMWDREQYMFSENFLLKLGCLRRNYTEGIGHRVPAPVDWDTNQSMQIKNIWERSFRSSLGIKSLKNDFLLFQFPTVFLEYSIYTQLSNKG